MTVILYLTDVEEGDETEFPKIHLKVRPKKGNALFFWNLYVAYNQFVSEIFRAISTRTFAVSKTGGFFSRIENLD